MAFAKAKIQRFNEVIGCAPPPGTYQPKWQEKPLLGIIERGKRFTERKSNVEFYDTPMKMPALQKKEHHFKYRFSRRQTYLKDESFSSLTSAESSVKDENPNEESVHQKTCDCNILIDSITKKYDDTIESLTKRLKILNKYEVTDSVEHSTDSNKVNVKHNQAESTHETMSQSYQQEIIEYRLMIAELQDTIDCLTAEKNVLSMDYFIMKKRIGELEEEIKRKNLKIEEAESLADSESKSIDMLKRGIHNLRVDLEDSKSKVKDLQQKFDNVNQELIMERSKKEELQARYENALSNAKEEVNKMSEEIQDLTNTLKKKLLIIDQEKRIRFEQVEDLSNEVNKMKQLHEADLVRYKELEDELYTARKELSTAASKVEELSLFREGMEYVLNDMMADIGGSENTFLMNTQNRAADKILDFLKSLIKAKKEVDLLNKELEREIEKKELHIQNLEQLIGPFREQLENYEQERQALENLTKQTKGEFEALSLQHAALLGHQNHKQKIQYMVKLKEKNLHLLDEIEDLKGKLRQKERTIAKLTNQSKDEPKTPSSRALHPSRKENAVSNS